MKVLTSYTFLLGFMVGTSVFTLMRADWLWFAVFVVIAMPVFHVARREFP